ncbi:hypothetical protein M885DRAFT_545454, partial [Pelagophyceae sp. CCMP2097]
MGASVSASLSSRELKRACKANQVPSTAALERPDGGGAARDLRRDDTRNKAFLDLEAPADTGRATRKRKRKRKAPRKRKAILDGAGRRGVCGGGGGGGGGGCRRRRRQPRAAPRRARRPRRGRPGGRGRGRGHRRPGRGRARGRRGKGAAFVRGARAPQGHHHGCCVNEIVCAHVCAAARKKGVEIHTLVNPCDTTVGWHAQYAHSVELPSTAEIESFRHLREPLWRLPPALRRKAGRPKKQKRKKSGLEVGLAKKRPRRMTCGNCGKKDGHNKG